MELADRSDLVEFLFDSAIKKCFPEASEVELYGAGIEFNADGSIVMTCAGKTVVLPNG